jgi:hypothetical protein
VRQSMQCLRTGEFLDRKIGINRVIFQRVRQVPLAPFFHRATLSGASFAHATDRPPWLIASQTGVAEDLTTRTFRSGNGNWRMNNWCRPKSLAALGLRATYRARGMAVATFAQSEEYSSCLTSLIQNLRVMCYGHRSVSVLHSKGWPSALCSGFFPKNSVTKILLCPRHTLLPPHIPPVIFIRAEAKNIFTLRS